MKTLIFIVIYKHPKDYPNQYVARHFDWDKPTDNFIIHDKLAVVRRWAIERLKKLGVNSPKVIEPQKNDDPHILEIHL